MQRHLILPLALVAAAISAFHSVDAAAQSRDSEAPTPVVEAARRAREALQHARHNRKVITNEDIARQYPEPPRPRLSFAAMNGGAQQLSSEASSPAEQPEKPFPPPGAFVISDNDLDLQYYQPGQQGLEVATPRLETAPPPPPEVERQIQADIQARTSPPDDPIKPTDSPEVVEVKHELAEALVALDYAQRLLALDQDVVYSNPDYMRDYAGLARLEEDEEDVAAKQEEVDRLRVLLAELEAKQETERSQTPEPPQP